MKWAFHFKEALDNLFSSKLRSTLALLGILVGTASVVAMVSGGKLATNEALKQFKTLGTDLLAVSINEMPSETNEKTSDSSLSLANVAALAASYSSILDIAPYTQIYNQMQFNGHFLNGSILGVTDSFGRITHVELLQGRFISSFDKYALFCVIGNHLYQEIKKMTYSDPLGQQIQVGQNYFTIVGVAKPWQENGFLYANIDDSILVPLLASTSLSKYAKINNIVIKLAPKTDIDVISEELTRYIKQQIPGKKLYFRSAKEILASMERQSQILTVFLGFIGGISLLVG